MTTNSFPEHDPIEEALLVQWLAPLDAGLPAFDSERADRIAQSTMDVFLSSEPAHPAESQKASPPSVPKRQKNMLAKALVALSALLGTITWFLGHGPARAEVTISV